MQLERSFFARDTQLVARNLIGKQLWSKVNQKLTAGTIVETEAYLPRGDSACHATKARTARTEVMFGLAGFAYVYPIHAKVCFNVVTENEELGCAVLIRALEPTHGLDVMRARRAVDDIRRLTTGPACLCQSLGIERSLNAVDLTNPRGLLKILDTGAVAQKIKRSSRIGVTSAKSKRLRFYVPGSRFVSGPLSLRT